MDKRTPHLALVVAEYADGRISVQAFRSPKQAEELFDDCKRADAEIRMSLIIMDLQDVLALTGKSKLVSLAPPRNVK